MSRVSRLESQESYAKLMEVNEFFAVMSHDSSHLSLES